MISRARFKGTPSRSRREVISGGISRVIDNTECGADKKFICPSTQGSPMGLSKKSGGWGNLGPIFQLAKITFKYRLYRLLKLIPEELIHGFGMWFGERFLARSKAVERRIIAALELIYKDRLSPPKLQKIARHTIRFMGLLAFDTIMVFPTLTPSKLGRRLNFENLHHYHAAVRSEKGVIVTSIHLSQFFRGIISVPLLDESRKTYAIANVRNAQLYSLPFYQNNIRLIPSVAYKRSRKKLMEILGGKNVLIIAWDMGSKLRQLKVKFMDYLLPTPGSVVSLALETGATVLPAVMIPRDGYTKHTIRFLEPFTVATRGSKKETFGYYNTHLNALFTPYFRAYPFLWEEILGFSNRTRAKFQFPNGFTQLDFLALAGEYLQLMLETSWEANRDDIPLEEICTRIAEFTRAHDKDFSYPYRTERKVRFFGIDLDGTSIVKIFKELLVIVREFPNIKSRITEGDKLYLRPRDLEAGVESEILELLDSLHQKESDA